jgi:ferric-dicitrate binding protein FerR (iron transport regulator)
MYSNRLDDVRPYPEGSDWTDPAPGLDDTPTGRSERRRALMVLWACVAGFALISVVLVWSDTVIYEATNREDVGPLDGVTAFVAVLFGVLFGAWPLVLALWHSAAAVRGKRTEARRDSRRAAVYTAVCGLITAAYWAFGGYQTSQDRRVAPPAMHEAYLLFGTTALIGLVPVALYGLTVRRARAAR